MELMAWSFSFQSDLVALLSGTALVLLTVYLFYRRLADIARNTERDQ